MSTFPTLQQEFSAVIDNLKARVKPPLDSSVPDGEDPWYERLATNAWNQVKDIVVIRHERTQSQPLMSPKEAYFLHENLKLTLLVGSSADFEVRIDEGGGMATVDARPGAEPRALALASGYQQFVLSLAARIALQRIADAPALDALPLPDALAPVPLNVVVGVAEALAPVLLSDFDSEAEELWPVGENVVVGVPDALSPVADALSPDDYENFEEAVVDQATAASSVPRHHCSCRLVSSRATTSSRAGSKTAARSSRVSAMRWGAS